MILWMRETWMPKGVDELRVATNPKESYKGVVLGGKTPIQNLGMHGKQEKNRPDTYFCNTPERYFVTNGAEIAPTMHSQQMLKATTKDCLQKEYYGNANKLEEKKHNYITTNYEQPKKDDNNNCVPVTNVAVSKYAPLSQDNHVRDGYSLPNNMRTLTKNITDFGGISGSAIKAWVTPVLDTLRPTRKNRRKS